MEIGLHKCGIERVGQATVVLLNGTHHIGNLAGATTQAVGRFHQAVALLYGLRKIGVVEKNP